MASSVPVEALTWRERFARLPEEDREAVLAMMDRLEAKAETPVAALFRERTAAREAEELGYQIYGEEEARDRGWQQRVDVENKLMAEPSQTMDDWALKIIAYTDYGIGCAQGNHEKPALWAEVRALFGA